MTAQTLDANVATALEHFPLRGPVAVERSTAGFMNDNWLVSDAATGRRYVLRRYIRVADAGRIAFQLAFQEHLRANGFPTAPVLQTHNRRLFASVEGRQFSLSAFLEGREFDFTSLAQAREAGRRLADFHATAEGYVGPPVGTPIVEIALPSDEHEERLRERHRAPEHVDDLAFFSRWRREAARAWPPDRLAPLPVAWLHCDYHGRNMVFQDDKLVGLFDFDFVRRGPRTYDVGRSVFNFGRAFRGSTTLREDFVRAFLAGFEAAQPLTGEERRSLPIMAVLNWVPDAAFPAAHQREPKKAGDRAHFRLGMQRMRAVEAEMRRLAPQFGWGGT
jgi:Ser/Thr protein kinase RdoA (MazF antagonist)